MVSFERSKKGCKPHAHVAGGGVIYDKAAPGKSSGRACHRSTDSGREIADAIIHKDY
jgi:hypothetical protein